MRKLFLSVAFFSVAVTAFAQDSETKKNPDGSTTILEQKVDGRFLRSKTLDKNGALKFTDLLTYDQAGNLVRVQRTKPDGSVWMKVTKAASNGAQAQTRYIGRNGQETTAQEFEK